MKQSGKQIQNENLQEFLDSAANALEKGQQQFYTPRNLAEALCRPLPAMRRELVLDMNFGCGNLALGAAATHALGLDIDHRVTRSLVPPENAKWSVMPADVTHWFPIAAEIGFTAPFILLNPPFSLKWHAPRFADALRNSDIPAISAAAATFGDHADSTLASFLMALHMLPYNGEGFMVCDAGTARRFFGDPEKSHSDARHPGLSGYIWMWLEIPGAIYENQHTKFDTAVLYFSRSHANHRQDPLFLRSPSHDALAVERTIMCPEAFNAHRGSRIRHEHECRRNDTLEKFSGIAAEYAVRHQGERPAWNIRLHKGEIRTYLTPFQRTSKKLDRNLIQKLATLDGHTPMSLCVTATSRTALREAVQGGVWTVEPEVMQAVSQCLDEYAREGAPFYRPNEVQALGWVDEHSTLECKAPGLGTFRPGTRYPFRTTVEQTVWEDKRTNLDGEEEKLSYTGNELLISIFDEDGCDHAFHVRKDEKSNDDETDKDNRVTRRHLLIDDLVKHFLIPIPEDIATLRPVEYQSNLDRLADLEAIINSRMNAA
jgi:predicted RNA methylase